MPPLQWFVGDGIGVVLVLELLTRLLLLVMLVVDVLTPLLVEVVVLTRLLLVVVLVPLLLLIRLLLAIPISGCLERYHLRLAICEFKSHAPFQTRMKLPDALRLYPKHGATNRLNPG